MISITTKHDVPVSRSLKDGGCSQEGVTSPLRPFKLFIARPLERLASVRKERRDTEPVGARPAIARLLHA